MEGSFLLEGFCNLRCYQRRNIITCIIKLWTLKAIAVTSLLRSAYWWQIAAWTSLEQQLNFPIEFKSHSTRWKAELQLLSGQLPIARRVIGSTRETVTIILIYWHSAKLNPNDLSLYLRINDPSVFVREISLCSRCWLKGIWDSPWCREQGDCRISFYEYLTHKAYI